MAACTWETQLEAGGPPLHDVQFVDCRSGWAVGDNGTILHTGDGGATWDPQGSGTSAHLVSVSLVGTSAAWAVAGDGAMVRTTDGGATWETLEIPLNQDAGGDAYIGSIDFVNETTGWAAGGTYGFTPGGNWGQLYRTTDAGATWQELRRFDDPLTSVCFLDEAHGWAVGNYGTAVHTSDGGTTWHYEETGAGRLDSVCFVSATDGWIVGSGGAILHSATGGLPDGGPGVAPSCTTTFAFAPDATSDWHDADQTVALTASGGGAARAIHYSDDGGATWAVSVGDSVDVVVSNEGSHHFQYFASDTHETEALHDAGYVNVDKTAPVTTAAGADADWHRRPVTVTLNADDALSGAQHDGVQDRCPSLAGRHDRHHQGPARPLLGRGAHGLLPRRRQCRQRGSDQVGQGAYRHEGPRLLGDVGGERDPGEPRDASLPCQRGAQPESGRDHQGEDAERQAGEELPPRLALHGQGAHLPHLCTFSPKTYRYFVYARDLAGNAQSHIGANTLTVWPRALSRSLGVFR